MNSRPNHAVRLVAICLAAAAGFSGCGKSDLPGESGTVSGRVTFQGQPCPAGALVMFLHIERGLVARGVTDSDGAFQLSMRDRPDVLVGEYMVSVMPPPEDPETSRALESGQPLTEKQKEFLAREWTEIPERYRGHSLEGERFTVQTGKNEYLLDMQEGPPKSHE